MWTCYSILCVLTLATIFSSEIGTGSEVTSHYTGTCARGRPFRDKCYKLGYRVPGTARPCPIVVIEDAEENEFVREMVIESGEEYVWIQVGEDVSYHNFDYQISGDCYDFNREGKWSATDWCSLRQRPVCVYKPDCEEGWIGKNCDKKCHCYKESCTRDQGRCQYGCEPGWAGRDCSREAEAPIVEHYCVKYRTHYALVLVKNPQSSETGSLVPLDVDGYPINPEQNKEGFNGSDVFEITTTDLSVPFQPNYHEKKIDELGTTFEWYLRFRHHNNLWMQSDIDFRARCNFSEVDDMFSSTSLNFEKNSFGKPSSSTPVPTEVDVEMILTDPKDGGTMTDIFVGQPVKIIMKQTFSNAERSGEDAPDQPLSLSPRSCHVTSPDNRMVQEITNDFGCMIHDDYFGWIKDNQNNDFATVPFSAFGVPGYSSLNISCHLRICFHGVYNFYCGQTCSND